MKKILFPAVLAIALMAMACEQPTKPEAKVYGITIKGVSWMSENIDTSFWTGTSIPTNHMFQSFWIDYTYEGGTLSASAVDYVSITTTSGASWPGSLGYSLYGADNYLEAYRYSSSNDAGESLPLGNFVVTVKLKNGKSDSWPFTVTAPGSTSSGTYSIVKSEAYTGGSSSAIFAVKRPSSVYTSSRSGITSNPIATTFTLADSNILNGYLWFYDANGYVGRSPYFFDLTNGTQSTTVSGTFTVAGSNTVTVSSTDITYASGKGSVDFPNITKVVVVVTDGKQYPGHGSSWDYRAISEKVDVH